MDATPHLTQLELEPSPQIGCSCKLFPALLTVPHGATVPSETGERSNWKESPCPAASALMQTQIGAESDSFPLSAGGEDRPTKDTLPRGRMSRRVRQLAQQSAMRSVGELPSGAKPRDKMGMEC